jgi:hypothetical protein
VVIILAGKLRGNQDNWETLDAFKYNNNASLFIGSYEPNEWEAFPIPNNIIQTYYISDTFHNCFHQDVERYRHQWSSLFLAWEHFKNKIDENEVIVKLRNDFMLYGDLELDFNSLENNTIYVPEKEFHEPKPFDTNTVCNDQIVVGTKKSMSIYFQFPKNIFSPQPNTMSVEELLREYLRQQNLNLQTFKWTYTKHL